MADDLKRYFQEKQELVNQSLRESLNRLGKGCPTALMEAIRYSLLAPGKRLRPILVIMVAEACNGTGSAALPAACAVEMIHTYSLVHDDLPAMDDDDLRRGLPTCHKQFNEAMAILVGDALLTYAFEVLAEGYPAKTAAQACKVLARASGAAGMVGGQVEDLAWERQGGKLEDLVGLHGRKTGALFRACLQLGLLAVQGEEPNGPDPALQKALDDFGRCFGLAFQITDDLLDVQGTEETTGKRVNKDAGRGKLTFPGMMGIDQSRQRILELAQEGNECLLPLGESAAMLKLLFCFVLERDH